MGLSLTKLGRYDDAISRFEKAIEVDKITINLLL